MKWCDDMRVRKSLVCLPVPLSHSVATYLFLGFVLTNLRRVLDALLSALTPSQVPGIARVLVGVFAGQRDVDLVVSVS